jgi:hypothetical protein
VCMLMRVCRYVPLPLLRQLSYIEAASSQELLSLTPVLRLCQDEQVACSPYTRSLLGWCGEVASDMCHAFPIACVSYWSVDGCVASGDGDHHSRSRKSCKAAGACVLEPDLSNAMYCKLRSVSTLVA